MTTIYVDVLVSINILITYIFLVCVRVFLRYPTNKWGVGIASLLGGLSSLIIFVPNLNVIVSVLYKVLLCSLIVTVSFLPKKFIQFIKSFLAFFGVTFLFGGAIYTITLCFGSKRVLYMNGTVYFDMSIKYLVGIVFVIYGLFIAFDYFLMKSYGKNKIYDVKIRFRDIQVSVKGFLDTGNSMTDAMSGRPVVIGEIDALSPLFTYEELVFLKGEKYEDIPDSLVGKFRLIPCKTVGGSSLIPIFKPDELRVNDKSSVVSVAIVNKDLSGNEYNILLNRNMME